MTAKHPAPRTLLQIGGGRLQLPLLGWARAAGLSVVLADGDEAAPGRPLADRFHGLRGDDVPALVALARELAAEGNFAGATCNNDFGLSAVAAIGAATGTPANSPTATARALDKRAAKERWQGLGIATPTWFDVTSAAETVRAVTSLLESGQGAVVKPADSSGSRGVTSLAAAHEAERAWQAARAHGEHVLVEELVVGRHLDVNGLFLDGAFHPAGILDRHFTAPPTCVPVFGTQPAQLSSAEERRVYRLLENAARALGLGIGPIKGDVILGAAGPVLLEVAPRFHGEVSTAHVSPLCFGASPLEAWVRYLANGERPVAMALPATGAGTTLTNRAPAAGWLAILPERAGRFVGLTGEDAARDVSGITDLLVTRRVGTELPETRDNRSVCGFLWATGKDPAEVESTLFFARSRIEVIVE